MLLINEYLKDTAGIKWNIGQKLNSSCVLKSRKFFCCHFHSNRLSIVSLTLCPVDWHMPKNKFDCYIWCSCAVIDGDRHCVGCLQSARVLFSPPYLLKSLTVVSWDSLSHVCCTDNVITHLDQTSHVHVRYLSSRQSSRGWVTHDRPRSRTELSFLYLCLWVRIHTLLRMGNTPSEKIDVNFSKGINYVCDSSCGVSVVYENTWLPRTTACMASARSRQGNGMTSLTQLLLLSADGWKWKKKAHAASSWLSLLATSSRKAYSSKKYTSSPDFSVATGLNHLHQSC